MYVHNPDITTIAEASEDNTQAYSNKSQQISCVKQCKINVTPLSRKKQRNLGLRFQAFPLLEFSPALESCSDVYSVPTSCLIVTLLFNLLFLRYFPLFIFQFSLSIVDLIVSVLYTQIERSLLSSPLLLIGCKWKLRSKAIFFIAWYTFNTPGYEFLVIPKTSMSFLRCV